MEKRELQREDIDRVRGIEGFPKASDNDISSLSAAPFYTACPNPFVKDFINEYGKKYEEESDTYRREPFSYDVSEGKNDPIYGVHSYHTKVPYRAIMRYILHYTDPGEIVFDGFCGTGMTGVAAQLCENPSTTVKLDMEAGEDDIKWGGRYAILSDLSPAATFIAANYNNKLEDPIGFKKRADRIIEECDKLYGWMYRTKHTVEEKQGTLFDDNSKMGTINYVIWSDAFICPTCGNEFVFWDLSVDVEKKKPRDILTCGKCGAKFKKTDCEHSKSNYFDKDLNSVVSVSKQVPVMINYTYAGKRYDKKPDKYDLEILKRVEEEECPYWIPTDELPDGYNTEQPKKSHGFNHVNQFFTRRNLFVIAFILNKANELQKDERLALYAAVKSSFSYGTKMVKVNVGRMLNGGGLFALGAVTGTLYIPSNTAERPLLDAISNKVDAIIKTTNTYPDNKYVLVSTGSLTDMKMIPENSIDYIFTDPPFGDNLNYSELNFLWEAWQKVLTNNGDEAIINPVQKKGISEYQELMTKCFKEYYRVLKPNRWITIEFHNSKNKVWNAIQEGLLRSGFIVADVRTLDKQQGSFKQTTSTTAVKQDLVISAYKPNQKFQREMKEYAGTTETAWSFVRQHLEKASTVVVNNGKIEIVSERQAFLLWDRMVAHHIANGIPVPMDAADFYKGLDERFLQRDGMYFLPDQVNEYDTARIVNDIEPVQFSLFVTNEKTAIAWLYQQLDVHQTYAELQPKFMQEIKAVDKYEEMPELRVLLEENFLQDEQEKWYIPDVTKEGDIIKLREKKLLKEFEGYAQSKGKLKLFRSEAIRVGFSKLWKDKDYNAIVTMAERLPEQIVQEDQNLLMYYDISKSRL